MTVVKDSDRLFGCVLNIKHFLCRRPNVDRLSLILEIIYHPFRSADANYTLIFLRNTSSWWRLCCTVDGKLCNPFCGIWEFDTRFGVNSIKLTVMVYTYDTAIGLHGTGVTCFRVTQIWASATIVTHGGCISVYSWCSSFNSECPIYGLWVLQLHTQVASVYIPDSAIYN